VKGEGGWLRRGVLCNIVRPGHLVGPSADIPAGQPREGAEIARTLSLEVCDDLGSLRPIETTHSLEGDVGFAYEAMQGLDPLLTVDLECADLVSGRFAGCFGDHERVEERRRQTCRSGLGVDFDAVVVARPNVDVRLGLVALFDRPRGGPRPCDGLDVLLRSDRHTGRGPCPAGPQAYAHSPCRCPLFPLRPRSR
jgi:hypothetical protein